MAEVRQAGPVVEHVASGALGGGRVVATTGSSGQIVHADNNTPTHRDAVKGITTGAISSGATGKVQVFGPMADPAWTWTPGGPIYCGANGILTQAVPTSGWVRQVAIAETATRIFVDLQPPIQLS